MITAYDSITAADIPTSAQMVLGYLNGSWPWSAVDWARFPNARKETISVTPFENVGDWLDVETGDAFPWQAPSWVVARRQAGHPNPGVYVQGSLWGATRNEFLARGIPEPRWWVAEWDGVAQIPSGAFAKQYAAPHPGTPYDSGGHYDLSVFNYTFAGGIDTIGDEMTPDQAAALEETRNKTNEIWDLVRDGHHATNPRWMPAKLEEILAAVQAIKVGNAVLTPAQAAQLTHIEAMLTGGLKGT